MLNYFWTAVTPCRGRQHLMDGTTIEYSYYPGETRHESYGAGEFKVHDLENIGDADMVFMTVEFIEGSANKPLTIPDAVRKAGLTARISGGGIGGLAAAYALARQVRIMARVYGEFYHARGGAAELRNRMLAVRTPAD